MPIFQAWNPRTKAWVKYKAVKGEGVKILEVKKKDPHIKFKDVPVKKKN